MENLEDSTQIIEYKVDRLEQYQGLIDEIRARITLDEQGLTGEVREIVQECKNEIVSLRTSIEDLQQENMKIFEDNCTMARQLYVNEKLQEIKSDAVKQKIMKLLLSSDADMKFMDLEQIDNMFKVILGEK